MRYYVYTTEADADAEQTLIRDRGFALAQQVGRTVTQSGLASERWVQDEIDDPDSEEGQGQGAGHFEEDEAAVTTQWAVPMQRADGKWVIPHPEEHPASENPEYLAFVVNGITTPIETATESWWPSDDLEE